MDIVLVAIVFLSYLGRHYTLAFSFSIYFALASAIWLIYTVDHLMDSAMDSVSERRVFHRKFRETLIFIGGIVLSLAIVNLYFLPHTLIKNGAVVASFCVGYLLLVYFVKRLWFKELLVALGYSTGIFLAPLSLVSKVVVSDYYLVAVLFLIAFINLIIFSYFDRLQDEADGFGSIANKLGARITIATINALVVFTVGLSVLGCFLFPEGQALFEVYLVMTFLLASIVWFPKYFRPHERYRLLGDGVFFIPLIFLL